MENKEMKKPIPASLDDNALNDVSGRGPSRELEIEFATKSFESKEIKLDADIDLDCHEWIPIGKTDINKKNVT